MKKTISKWIAIAIMAGAVTFSLLQMRIPVVRADGCPSNPFPECLCTLSWYTSAESGGVISYYCVYRCSCGSPSSGEHFEIEREWVS